MGDHRLQEEKMNRFFASYREGESLYINDKQQIDHLKKVLRLTVGDEIEVVCESQEFVARIDEIAQSVECRIIEQRDASRESNIRIALFQGVPKADKMEYIVQKCTELGVGRIVPLDTIRTVSKIKKDAKLDRWNKIAFEAAKQSKRTSVPLVDKVMTINDLLDISDAFDLIIVPYENESCVSIKSALKDFSGDKIAIVIGPEGGFDEKEIEVLSSFAKIVTLGKRILRTETAAMATVAIVQYEIGDLN